MTTVTLTTLMMMMMVQVIASDEIGNDVVVFRVHVVASVGSFRLWAEHHQDDEAHQQKVVDRNLSSSTRLHSSESFVN